MKNPKRNQKIKKYTRLRGWNAWYFANDFFPIFKNVDGCPLLSFSTNGMNVEWINELNLVSTDTHGNSFTKSRVI